MACQEAAAIWQHNRNYMSLQSTIAQRMQRGTYRCVQVKGIARIQITSAPARIHYWQADRQKITTLWRPPDRSNGNAEGQQCAAKGKEWEGESEEGKGSRQWIVFTSAKDYTTTPVIVREMEKMGRKLTFYHKKISFHLFRPHTSARHKPHLSIV